MQKVTLFNLFYIARRWACLSRFKRLFIFFLERFYVYENFQATYFTAAPVNVKLCILFWYK